VNPRLVQLIFYGLIFYILCQITIHHKSLARFHRVLPWVERHPELKGLLTIAVVLAAALLVVRILLLRGPAREAEARGPQGPPEPPGAPGSLEPGINGGLRDERSAAAGEDHDGRRR